MAKTFRSEEPRPGIVDLVDETGRHRNLSIYCPDCGSRAPDLYTARTELWRFYVPLDGLLCSGCLAQRMRGLEGKTHLSDFELGFAPGLSYKRYNIATTAPCLCGYGAQGRLCRCRRVLLESMLLLDKRDALCDWEVRTVLRLLAEHRPGRYRG